MSVIRENVYKKLPNNRYDLSRTTESSRFNVQSICWSKDASCERLYSCSKVILALRFLALVALVSLQWRLANCISIVALTYCQLRCSEAFPSWQGKVGSEAQNYWQQCLKTFWALLSTPSRVACVFHAFFVWLSVDTAWGHRNEVSSWSPTKLATRYKILCMWVLVGLCTSLSELKQHLPNKDGTWPILANAASAYKTATWKRIKRSCRSVPETSLKAYWAHNARIRAKLAKPSSHSLIDHYA